MTEFNLTSFPGAICSNPEDHTYYVGGQGADCPHCGTHKWPLIQFEAYAPKTDGDFEYLHATVHAYNLFRDRPDCWLCRGNYDADDVADELYQFELEQQELRLIAGITCPDCNGSGSDWDSNDVDAHLNAGGPESETVCDRCEGNGIIFE